MFTGIVETKGKITKFDHGHLTVTVPWSKKELHIGQSISVDGCCLTIVHIHEHECSFDVSLESIQRTSFAQRSVHDEVNLERGMRLGESLDGHLVTGHIDTTGVIKSIEKLDDLGSKNVWFHVPSSYSHWLVQKGSVAIDGISLTVNEVKTEAFSVALIPHTLNITTLGIRKPGDVVNLEFDLIAKYVTRLLQSQCFAMNTGKSL